MNAAAQWFNVSPRALCGCGVDVSGMQVHFGQRLHDGRSHGTGSAAKVNDNGTWRRGTGGQQCHSLGDQQFSPAPRYEYTRLNQNAPARELRPAEHVFQWHPGRAAPEVDGEFRGPAGFRQQQPGLLLSENAASRAQKSDDLLKSQGGMAVNSA